MEQKKPREHYLIDRISHKTVREAIDILNRLLEEDDTTEITMFICSEGGDLYSGIALYEFIRLKCKAPLVTVALGTVGSAGLMIFCAGKKRLATKHTRFLHHETKRNWEKGVSLNPQDLEWHLKDLDALSRLGDEIVAEATGKTLEVVTQWAKEDKIFTAEEAKAVGLVHDII